MSHPPRRVAALLLSLPLLACGGPGDASRATTPAEPSTEGTVWTGSAGEREFMELHRHTDRAAPEPLGEELEVAGARAYLSQPEGEARSAVLVIHEWWGLNDHIRHYADRLAAQGHAALAVDLYGGEVATTSEDAMRLMREVDEERALEILRAAVELLRSGPRVNAERVGVLGWCFGGGWSLEAGLRLDGIDTVVMYYGRPVLEPERLRALDGPLLAIFGTRDASIPVEQVDRFEAALDEAGLEHRVLRYDAEHAFANPSSARYQPEAASEAWEQVREHLARTLGPQ